MVGFSCHATPLTDLTRKGAFQWTTQAQECFERFKTIMTLCLVLALPDFSRPCDLHCNASGEGIGAVMSQDQHPISFESRKLQEPDRSFSVYYKEMLAIMHALAKFKQYLVGSKFCIKIDHNNLRYFLRQRNLNERKQI